MIQDWTDENHFLGFAEVNTHFVRVGPFNNVIHLFLGESLGKFRIYQSGSISVFEKVVQ